MKYQIYDGENSRLYAEDPIEEADTAKEAIIIFLKKTGRNYMPNQLRRSAGNDVLYKATPFEEVKGRKVRRGNDVWYKKV